MTLLIGEMVEGEFLPAFTVAAAEYINVEILPFFTKNYLAAENQLVMQVVHDFVPPLDY